MKKVLTAILALTLLLSLAACGGSGAQEAPDLNQYYEDFMASLGADNAPAMMDLEGELVEAYYPGLSGYAAKQTVLKAAAITMVSFEFALVELENESDAAAVAEIFQQRIDTQVEGGAFYPEAIASWEKARVITHGSIVAMIAAGDQQTAAADAFNALFE